MKNNISAQVDLDFIQKRKNGIRIEDIAIESSVGKSTVGRFHNGTSKASTMKLSTFEKLYPKAVIYLFGEKNAQKNKMCDIVDSNANIGNNNNIEANNFLPKEEKKTDDTIILEWFNHPENKVDKYELLLKIAKRECQNDT